MSDELKPCPFCGGEARMVVHEFGNTTIGCKADTGCNVYMMHRHPAEAIAAWNRRTNRDGLGGEG